MTCRCSRGILGFGCIRYRRGLAAGAVQEQHENDVEEFTGSMLGGRWRGEGGVEGLRGVKREKLRVNWRFEGHVISHIYE